MPRVAKPFKDAELIKQISGNPDPSGSKAIDAHPSA
jgi:hypothetical protein